MPDNEIEYILIDTVLPRTTYLKNVNTGVTPPTLSTTTTQSQADGYATSTGQIVTDMGILNTFYETENRIVIGTRPKP